jgi:hypothetical protein
MSAPRFVAYRIDSDTTLKSSFPPDVKAPQLLLDFAAWLRGRPWGSIGAFSLKGGEIIGALLPSGATEDENFAMFIRMPDGGLAGLWFRESRDPMQAAFVHMDSEGGYAILAPNFALFLHRVSQSRFRDRDGSATEFLPQTDDAPDHTAELAAWLAAHPVAATIIENATSAELKYQDRGSAARWLDTLVRDLEQRERGDPHLAAIAAVAAQHRLCPASARKQGFGETFQVYAAGESMTIRRGTLLIPQPNIERYLKPIKPVAEAELRAPLFAAREAHAQGAKGRGLWPSATLHVHADGTVTLQPNYGHPYAIGFDGFRAADFAADQTRFPRQPNQLEAWHRALIAEA